MPWGVVDYQVAIRNTGAAATTDATLVLSFTPPNATQVWRVESITCVCTGTAEPTFFVYDRTPGFPLSDTLPPAASTVKGSLTTGDGSPVTILSGGQLVLVWKGAAKGAVGYARVQYTILAGSPGPPAPVAA